MLKILFALFLQKRNDVIRLDLEAKLSKLMEEFTRVDNERVCCKIVKEREKRNLLIFVSIKKYIIQ